MKMYFHYVHTTLRRNVFIWIFQDEEVGEENSATRDA